MTAWIQLLSKQPRAAGQIILAICVACMASAFWVEYIGGVDPCVLCLYQRIPYVAAGAFAIFAIVGKRGGFTQQMALAGCGIAFMAGMSLAIYHFGVEEGFWQSSCSSTQAMNLSLEDLKASIMAEPVKSCDQKDWVVFGLSITVYNTLSSLALMIWSFGSLYIIRKLKEAA